MPKSFAFTLLKFYAFVPNWLNFRDLCAWIQFRFWFAPLCFLWKHDSPSFRPDRSGPEVGEIRSFYFAFYFISYFLIHYSLFKCSSSFSPSKSWLINLIVSTLLLLLSELWLAKKELVEIHRTHAFLELMDHPMRIFKKRWFGLPQWIYQ